MYRSFFWVSISSKYARIARTLYMSITDKLQGIFSASPIAKYEAVVKKIGAFVLR
jgi:hypothetical protein